jgi:hypothetical protein
MLFSKTVNTLHYHPDSSTNYHRISFLSSDRKIFEMIIILKRLNTFILSQTINLGKDEGVKDEG